MLSAKPSVITDTIPASGVMWIDRNDAMKVYTAAEKYKVSLDHIDLLKKDTAFLSKEIRSLQVALAALQKVNQLDSLRVLELQKQIGLTAEKFDLAGTRIKELEKENKKLRRRVRWTSISAIVVTGAAIYLSLK